MTAPKLAQPYLRTSTDDKGQDPLRQMIPVDAWAKREGFTVLRPIIDEGTSAWKENPFERSKFLEACELAERLGAVVIVETVDRLTREGSEIAAWTKVEVRRRYKGVSVIEADISEEMRGKTSGNIVSAIKADSAREWVEGHSARIKAGNQRRRDRGLKVGGAPPKPLTDEEMDMALDMRLRPSRGGNPTGWPTIAREISRSRGALDMTNPTTRRRRAVTASHVAALVEAEMRARGIRVPVTPWSRPVKPESERERRARTAREAQQNRNTAKPSGVDASG